MSYREIIYETDGDVAIIRLNRPKARNALTYQTYAELEDAVRGTGARCLVITGVDPAFCSGDDVKQIMAGPDGPPVESLDRSPRLTPAADALLHTNIPVVAAVNGAAVGWGMELAIMADLRVASERARFGPKITARACARSSRSARPSTSGARARWVGGCAAGWRPAPRRGVLLKAAPRRCARDRRNAW